MQENVSRLRKEHFRRNRTTNHKVVVEVDVVFAQVWNAPQHCLNTGCTEGWKVFFVAAKDDFVVNNLYWNSTFHFRILSVSNEKDAPYPRHELIYRTDAPVNLPFVGIAIGSRNILFLCFFRLDICGSFGVEHRIVAIHPSYDDIDWEVVLYLLIFVIHSCVFLLHLLCDHSQSSGCRRMVFSSILKKVKERG